MTINIETNRFLRPIDNAAPVLTNGLSYYLYVYAFDRIRIQTLPYHSTAVAMTFVEAVFQLV